jgi:hypothetical protein
MLLDEKDYIKKVCSQNCLKIEKARMKTSSPRGYRVSCYKEFTNAYVSD